MDTAPSGYVHYTDLDGLNLTLLCGGGNSLGVNGAAPAGRLTRWGEREKGTRDSLGR